MPGSPHGWFTSRLMSNRFRLVGARGARDVALETGDMVALPAGAGHCLVEADAGFEVIGAYPAGQEWDLCRDAPDDAMLQRISEVPFPASDPLEGPDGALPRLWRRT